MSCAVYPLCCPLLFKRHSCEENQFYPILALQDRVPHKFALKLQYYLNILQKLDVMVISLSVSSSHLGMKTFQRFWIEKLWPTDQPTVFLKQPGYTRSVQPSGLIKCNINIKLYFKKNLFGSLILGSNNSATLKLQLQLIHWVTQWSFSSHGLTTPPRPNG